MEEIKIRIKKILSHEDMPVSRLAGGNRTTDQVRMNNQINGDKRLSADTIVRVLSQFPNLSAEWLLRGEGDMYKSGMAKNSVSVRTMTGGSIHAGDGDHTDSSREQSMERQLKEKDARIAELTRDKQLLQQMVTMLQGANKLNDFTL